MVHAFPGPDGSPVRLTPRASASPGRVVLLAAVVIAAFAACCIGYTLIAGGTVAIDAGTPRCQRECQLAGEVRARGASESRSGGEPPA